MEDRVKESTIVWRSVLEAYELLKERHKEFVEKTDDALLNFADPGLQKAIQLRFHKTRFQHFVEDLVALENRSGGLKSLW